MLKAMSLSDGQLAQEIWDTRADPDKQPPDGIDKETWTTILKQEVDERVRLNRYT